MNERPPLAPMPEDAPKMPNFRGDRRAAGNRFAGVLRFLQGPRNAERIEERVLAEASAGDPESAQTSTSEFASRLTRSNPDVSTDANSRSPDAISEPETEAGKAGTEREFEISDEDRAVVKTSIRDLQRGDECPECFPLSQTDLDRLAAAVHGISSPDDARKTVSKELEAIAKRKGQN